METATMPQKISSASLHELKPFIVQTISEVLNDPDFGLELSGRAQARLRQARESSGKTISFNDIKRKYH